jgi:two-component system heavy metal sensor histidine kinase CusS
MKLRHRVALMFAALTSTLLIASRGVTIASFQQSQQRDLDESLRERARIAAAEIANRGRRAFELEHDPNVEQSDPLEELVTYGALYRADGTLVADTLAFPNAPSPTELGWRPGANLPSSCFDFPFRDTTLRGVLTEVVPSGSRDRQVLLIAASRRGMDADARKLLELGWWVTVAAVGASLVVGWLFGKRMTRGVEGIAAAARRVTAGDLDARIATVGRDEEVVELAKTLTQMVERLRALIENERRFASHAAHELRSPLAALRGELELALRRPRTTDEYAAAIRAVLDDTNRLIKLSEDLLAMARRAASGERRESRCSARELVEEAVDASLARSDAARQVKLDVEDVDVRGDRRDLVRMVRNLIDNAVAHAPEGTSVLVRVRRAPSPGRSDGIMRLDVEDDGPGVPEPLRERIFEPFFRGDSDREHSGAGLGLGIAREVARAHGGDVELESSAPVTRFVVRLPALAPEEPSEREARENGAATRASKPSVPPREDPKPLAKGRDAGPL